MTYAVREELKLKPKRPSSKIVACAVMSLMLFTSVTWAQKKVTADDGSISIYVQAKSPGQDKETNWLPAPDGPCWMVLRIYGPGKSILDGTWKVPPVKALN
jgi:hypothetical protein